MLPKWGPVPRITRAKVAFVLAERTYPWEDKSTWFCLRCDHGHSLLYHRYRACWAEPARTQQTLMMARINTHVLVSFFFHKLQGLLSSCSTAASWAADHRDTCPKWPSHLAHRTFHSFHEKRVVFLFEDVVSETGAQKTGHLFRNQNLVSELKRSRSHPAHR